MCLYIQYSTHVVLVFKNNSFAVVVIVVVLVIILYDLEAFCTVKSCEMELSIILPYFGFTL